MQSKAFGPGRQVKKEKCFGTEVRWNTTRWAMRQKSFEHVLFRVTSMQPVRRAECKANLARGKYLLINMHFKSKMQASFNKQMKLNNIHISQHLRAMEGASQPFCKELKTPALQHMLYWSHHKNAIQQRFNCTKPEPEPRFSLQFFTALYLYTKHETEVSVRARRLEKKCLKAHTQRWFVLAGTLRAHKWPCPCQSSRGRGSVPVSPGLWLPLLSGLQQDLCQKYWSRKQQPQLCTCGAHTAKELCGCWWMGGLVSPRSWESHTHPSTEHGQTHRHRIWSVTELIKKVTLKDFPSL